MKAKLLALFVLYVFMNPTVQINGTQLTIAQPGFYQLGEDFIVSPTANGDTVITIASSDVTLDFNGHFILQTNNTATIAGVFINPALNDIIIQNGVIQNITGTGLIITASDMRIEILNMTFTNCSAAAITADGSAGTIKNLEIRGCTMSGCCSNSTDRNVILFSNCTRSRMLDCMLDNTLNTFAASAGTTEFAMIAITSCSMCTFKDIWIQNNTFNARSAIATPNANMIQESGNNNCEFNSVIVRNNNYFNSTNGFFNGFRALTLCDSNRYTGCQCIANNVLNTLAGGLDGFFGIWTNSIFSRCFVTSCSIVAQTRVAGILTPAGARANVIKDCVIAGNSSSIGLTGIISNDFDTLFTGCIVAYNASTAAAVTSGINLAVTNGHSVLYENIAHRNMGNNSANSLGFITPGGFLLSRNIAYNNGTTAANQFSGLSATSQSQVTSDQVATVGTAWTNLAVTQ